VDKRTVFRRLTIAGFMGFTLVVVAIFARQGWIAATAREWVQHSYTVRDQIQRVFVKIKDLELGQRGYVLSGDSSYLEPYQRALYGQIGAVAEHGEQSLTLWDETRILGDLVSDNSPQALRADSLELMARRRVAYADSIIRLRRDSGLAAAVAMARRGGGQRLMKDTRALVLSMLDEEEALLAARLEAEAARQRANSFLLYGVVVLFYIAWLWSLRLASRARFRRLRAESSLRESNARLEAVINGTDYAIFAADAAGIVRVYSRGAERMLGYTAAEEIGLPVAVAAGKAMLPEEIEARSRKIAEQYGRPPSGMDLFVLPLDSDGPYGHEWTYVRKDGSRLNVALNVSLLPDGGSVAIARDITALKAVERLKNEFVSTVSHELRTPLTSIRGALGLVAGGAAGALPPKAEELVSIAHRNSERLVHIINDILDIEKIESGKLSMRLEPVGVAGFLRQAADVNRAYGEKYDVRFVLKDVPEGKVFVSADPDRLMQIMANLLSNAAKFSAAGSEVWVGARPRGAALRFTVRDFGRGIPESFRDRVFEKFAQAEGTDTRSRDGTGLGLNITRKLVEAMQGSIGFETEVGKGTTFYFELPLAAAEIPPVTEGGGEAPAGGARPRVLICEDDPDVGTLLRLLLERAGLRADVARTIAETRTLLREHHYAALTLDLMLPDGSGLTLLRELRRDARTQDLPVIVISAKAEEGRRELNGDAIGMIDWMAKPINEDRLTASLRRAVAGAGKPRILHIEDDADFRHILARSLQDSAEWVGAATLREAETLLEQGFYDLVVLDLDLPDGSGLELLERLKSLPGGPVPVLILSASETDNGIRNKVEAALVKSRLSEERIVETILAQIRKQSHPQGGNRA
jgi:PAS domain S-box-containing protein